MIFKNFKAKYNRWVLPTKLSFWFGILGIASLVLTICFYYYPYKQNEAIAEKDFMEIQNEWAEIIRQNDWGKLEKNIQKYESDGRYKNVFFLYKGTELCYKSKKLENPAPFFYKIDSHSRYYMEGIKCLFAYYIREYKGEGKQWKQNVRELISELEKVKLKKSFYYLLQTENHKTDLEALSESFDNFQAYAGDFYDFDSHEFEITLKISETFRVHRDYFFQISTVTYLYLNQLYILSEGKEKQDYFDQLICLRERKTAQINEGFRLFAIDLTLPLPAGTKETKVSDEVRIIIEPE